MRTLDEKRARALEIAGRTTGPRHNSPNAGWERGGYTIKRIRNAGGTLRDREIYSPDGTLFASGLGHSGETAKLKELGLIDADS